jgi:hypothetical protein
VEIKDVDPDQVLEKVVAQSMLDEVFSGLEEPKSSVGFELWSQELS